MGMDVYGHGATTDVGHYFRNNVWWWHPLWDYCLELYGEQMNDRTDTDEDGNEFTLDPGDGHMNSAYGLDEEQSIELGNLLQAEIDSGRTKEYETKYREYLASLKRKDCNLCEATGIRTDGIGRDMGMVEKALEPEIAALTGRTHGYCNACHGIGTQPSFETNYPFSVENVQEFALFLLDCGGFEIN